MRRADRRGPPECDRLSQVNADSRRKTPRTSNPANSFLLVGLYRPPESRFSQTVDDRAVRRRACMRVLIVGDRAANDALAWTLARESGVAEVVVTIVDNRLARDGLGRSIATAANPASLLAVAERERIDLTDRRSRAATRTRPRRSVRVARTSHLRSVARRRRARNEQGIREDVHGAASYSDGALSIVC